MSDLDNNSKLGISTVELSQRRRALIKGSAVAIPAILTLRSGSALAASSNVGCIQRGNDGAKAVTESDDSWLRTDLNYRTLEQKEPVSGSTINVYEYPKGGGMWYDEKTASTSLTHYTNDSGNGKMKGNDGTKWIYDDKAAPQTRWVLVQVDGNGDIITVVGASGTGYFASDSCYASIQGM